MITVKVITYKGGIENNYQPYYQGTTLLSMEDWIIQHNEIRGADINNKNPDWEDYDCPEDCPEVWENLDEFEWEEIRLSFKQIMLAVLRDYFYGGARNTDKRIWSENAYDE